jgi:iron-sulfur cluster assembly protein
MAETAETAETTTPVVTLTEGAQAAARKFLAAEPDAGNVLRVGVNSGGCSGFSYAVSIDVKKDDDIVLNYEGFEVVVDPVSKQFIQNATVDYVDTIGEAGFKFDNPQATNSCGCGTSFDV